MGMSKIDFKNALLEIKDGVIEDVLNTIENDVESQINDHIGNMAEDIAEAVKENIERYTVANLNRMFERELNDLLNQYVPEPEPEPEPAEPAEPTYLVLPEINAEQYQEVASLTWDTVAEFANVKNITQFFLLVQLATATNITMEESFKRMKFLREYLQFIHWNNQE